MSAGVFQRARYQCDDGTIGVVRIQPETAQLVIEGTTNEVATGTVNAGSRVRARKGKREYGIGARYVTIEWTGAPPTDYKPGGILTVPVLQEAFWEGINELDTGTYLGQPIQVISKSPENVK